ncbi:MAG TPA: hypothetical protein VGE14_06540 [Marmoricola sp.]
MTPGRRSAGLVAAAIATAVVLSGCGAENGSGDGTLTTAEFRDRAEEICGESNEAIQRLAEDFGPDGPTPEQLEVVAPKMPGLIGAELDRLAALRPPAELADEVAAMIADFRAVVATMRDQGAAFFEREDPSESFAGAYARASALGLDECAH